jgi:hypothetical protein
MVKHPQRSESEGFQNGNRALATRSPRSDRSSLKTAQPLPFHCTITIPSAASGVSMISTISRVVK